jgi:hypothetical protein
MVYSQAKCVLISQHYFVLKSTAAVHQAFRNTHPDKKVLNNNSVPTSNKIPGYRKCLSVKSALQAKKQQKLQLYQFQTVHQL